jgi:putative ABC transport system permease protein
MAIWAAVVLSVPFVAVLIGWPFLRRLATRNARRRPIEALLVIGGSLLGTAIITGSLIVGDTINRSIRAAAYDQLGPADELVSVPLNQQAALERRFGSFSSPAIDGVLFLTATGAAVVHPSGAGGTQPRAQLIEVNFDKARAFGRDPRATGISGATPRPGFAAITDDLAHKLHVTRGDRIVAFAGGGTVSLTIDRVLPRRGIAGFWTIDARQQSYNMFVAPGTTARLAASAAGGPTEPPEAMVAFSNPGGVESGARHTTAALAAIDRRLHGLGAKARPVKRDLLDRATTTGKSLSQLYFTVGMFAVAAGVLLLVNVFVMLADERRSELGMLRAMGMRRSHLVGSLAIEGWLYAVIASALGALLGIGFGRVIAWRADQILGSGREVNALHLTFTFTGSTVLTGFALGFVISIVTIVAASLRIARFNVIQAIRDIDTTHRDRPSERWAVLGIAFAALGVPITVLGFIGPESFSLMLGPLMIVVGLAPTAARHRPGRAVTVVTCAVVLVWAVASVPVLGALGEPVQIPVFLVQGLAMAAAAVILVTACLENLGAMLGRRGRSVLAARLGIAYPLARRFRTAMTLAMFAIVVLTLVYMSVLSFMIRTRSDSYTQNLSGGFGVVVQSNPNGPIPLDRLSNLPGVHRVAPLGYALAEFTTPHRTRTAWPVTGVGPALAEAPPHLRNRGSFPDDKTAWRAVVESPHAAIVDDSFLAQPGGPSTKAAKIGERIVMTDPVTGRTQWFIVRGLADNDLLGNGAFVSQSALTRVFQERAAPSRFFVSAANPGVTVRRIRSTFIANGADADTVQTYVTTALAQNSGFFTLMQQFVAAGLVVGVAGIGVIMFRAVRERRRDVGVLRALGFRAASVGNVFMFEAGFMALLGVGLGVAIALVASYALASSGADWLNGLRWGVPVGEVLVIVAVALGSAVAAALLPARQAANTQPAASLRTAD